MTPDRLDHLLDETLASGAIPPEATPDERAQIEEMLAGVAVLRRASEDLHSEADASMPVARARFQRHLAEHRPHISPPAGVRSGESRRGLFGGIFGSIGALRLSASAAAIGLVVIAAILVAQPFSGVETASALSVDDYVQVQGVVSETADNYVTVQSSEFGKLRIGLSDGTSIVDNDTVRDRSDLRPGDTVLVSGVVRDARKKDIRIDANTLALASNGPGATPTTVALKELRNFEEGIEGTVTVLAIAPDGRGARILIDAGRGHQLVVNVDRASAEDFVGGAGTPLGARVRIIRDDSLPHGVFRFETVAGTPTPNDGSGPTGGRPGMGGHGAPPALVRIEGVITARETDRVTVETDRGPVTVLVRPHTRILVGQSGLTLEKLRAGETAVSHNVTVRGGFSKGQDAMIADLIVLGPLASQ
ncbi:MAG: hypothetical protein IH609_02600 [Dehalococcoidia bacterium]|nr:hypothetical protein [Dehalococcoidia bacterium]